LIYETPGTDIAFKKLYKELSDKISSLQKFCKDKICKKTYYRNFCKDISQPYSCFKIFFKEIVYINTYLMILFNLINLEAI